METKKWTINKSGIKKSLKAVIDKKDISKLTKDAYRFTHNLSGFIAHYDINGFMSHYENVADFVSDLQNSSDISDWGRYTTDGFFRNSDQKEYYASKSEILKFIADLVENINVSSREEVVSFTRTVSDY